MSGCISVYILNVFTLDTSCCKKIYLCLCGNMYVYASEYEKKLFSHMYMHPMITLIPYTCIHVHICVIVYVCVYRSVCVCVCVYVCVWVSVRKREIFSLFILCMDTYMSAYVFVGICICMYLCLFICMHVSLYMCSELVGRVYTSLNFENLYLRSHWYMWMYLNTFPWIVHICVNYFSFLIYKITYIT